MHPLEAQLQASLPADVWGNLTTAVAVSGGADSVALACALAALRPTSATGALAVLHLNHGLRGPAAAADEVFVRRLAEHLGCPARIGQLTPGELTPGAASEDDARAARYRYFRAECDRLGARYLFLAHTADDQAETILQRILRGTGLTGLAGIPRIRPLSEMTTLVRPLLAVRRSEVLAYLEARGQAYCTDATNADPAFTRNRIRGELLPHLAERYNPQVASALWQLGQLAAAAQAVIDERVAALLADALQHAGPTQVTLRTAALAPLSEFLACELLLAVWKQQRWPLAAMAHEKWLALARLARAGADGALTLPGEIQAVVRDGCLTLCSRF